MKRKFIFLLSICLFLTASFSNLNAQKLEAEKTHELSKDAKKGYLGSFTYDATDGSFTLDGYKSDMTRALILIDKLAAKDEVKR